MKVPEQRFHLAVWVLALVLYGITAWYSTGYHNADEHHQIIAFAQHKLGELPEGHLTWEHATGIRSSIQPWIAVTVIQGERLMGMEADPNRVAFVLRLLSILLALSAIRAIVYATVQDVQQQLRKPYIVLSYFLWFLPFLAARFSSESWSAFLLLGGLAAMFHPQRSAGWPWRVGILLALAVVIRPSTVIIIAGVVGWLALVRKEKASTWFRLLIAASVVVICSSVLDTLFYGRVVISPVNYWAMALVGPPRDAFDTLPWYYYPPWIIKYAVPPIGIAMLVALGLLVWRRPKHLLVWCSVPFLVALSLVPHKEVRFLYPLAALVPWLLVAGLSLIDLLTKPVVVRWLATGLGSLCIVVNLLGLAVVVTEPAGSGNTAFLPHIGNGRTITYLTDPEEFWRIQIPPFYREEISGDTIVEPGTITSPLTTALLIAFDADLLDLEQRTGQTFTPIATSASPWAEHLFTLYKWDDGMPAIGVYAVGP